MARSRLLRELRRFLAGQLDSAPLRIVVALSGGPDSTALLWGLSRLREELDLQLVAAHLDHGEDPDSRLRAEIAATTAEWLGVHLIRDRRPVRELRRAGESPEAASRRVRYAFLRQTAAAAGCPWIALGHHRDDQAETILLRLWAGSGLAGLAAMRPRSGDLLRPLLGLPRTLLEEAVGEAGIEVARDPGNRDLDRPRNRIRHLVLPRLRATLPQAESRLATVARRIDRIDRRLRRGLALRLQLRALAGGAAISQSRVRELPRPLLPHALALAARAAGRALPPARSVQEELLRQMAGTDAVRVADTDEWEWTIQGEDLLLRHPPEAAEPFAYTLRAPGEVEIPELGVRMRLRRAAFEAWMVRGEPRRAGLGLPLRDGECVEVRSRRPGDRLRPLGADGRRRLKEVLIDRHVPRAQRDRLPLLVCDGRIAWVPGVTIEEAFRLRSGTPTWVAELRPLAAPAPETESDDPAKRSRS